MKNDGRKEDIRNVIRTKLTEVRQGNKESSDRRISEKLFSIPQIQNAHGICVYVAKDKEVETSGIFKALWKTRNTVVLAPRIKGAVLEMCQVHSIDDFTQGTYDLKEPSQYIPPYGGDIDVVIVPGLAFDVHGVRLGRGKGYYDRFLATTHAYVIGLAYDFQILPTIPNDIRDIKMNLIITEKRCISVSVE
jgi:5-formyltetrahydrofolate cyclo-ligase